MRTPSSPYAEYAAIKPICQFFGALIMFGLPGFLSGWGWVKIQSDLGGLRIPQEVEIQRLDFEENKAYDAAVPNVKAAGKAEIPVK